MLKKSQLKRKKSTLSDCLVDLNAQKWKKVKVRGIVKAEENATSLENLIGLEVLETYDPNLVAKVNIQRKLMNYKSIMCN